MSAKSAKVFDLSTGKEMVGIKKTNRKTYHVMDDGSMISYLGPTKIEKIKLKVKKGFNFFFDLDDSI